MFEPSDHPRVFAIAPGVDFPRALLDGLEHCLTGRPPASISRVHLIVNTQRMARRLRGLMDEGNASFLPRISLISDPQTLFGPERGTETTSTLRRRLELSRLIGSLLDQQPDLAARDNVYDLADSLAALIDEMQGEGVSTDTIRHLDVSDMSGHWARTQAFFDIADTYLATAEIGLDKEALSRQRIEQLVTGWSKNPPQDPVIVAGSTGSRGTTQMLMRAVAKLPEGAVILPGYDFDQPDNVWDQLAQTKGAEDHPQYRFLDLLNRLDMTPDQVRPWTTRAAPVPARNKMISLALRPAPFTDAWLSEGPQLPNPEAATCHLTYVEAPTPRSEALAIALRLRQAAHDGKSAALITPDRMLSRQVTAALDRWGITPDDSAGMPLHLSPPGRLLRQVARLLIQPLRTETLLALLKHPLCHSGTDRGPHLRKTRELELSLRRSGPAFPDRACFEAFAADHDPAWGEWLSNCFTDQDISGERPLSEFVARLTKLAEQIAAGPDDPDCGTLWEKQAGRQAQDLLAELTREAPAGGMMTTRRFCDLLDGLLSAGVVRDHDRPDGSIMIWGTLEARVQGADLVILGGLNEGSWPEPAAPDPWLNRRLRAEAGLLLPERRIGLSAHDFQQAINAPKVWLTRSRRSDDAETVTSRWLNRIMNLLGGLEKHGGKKLLADMQKRGDTWLSWAAALEAPEPCPPAIRPAPKPPVSARPRQLSVTEIKRLIRDPYAIYARHVLKLSPLNPLAKAPDALLRGIVIHEVLESFIKQTTQGTLPLTKPALLEVSARVLGELVSWPMSLRLWLARMDHVADHFIANEVERQARGTPVGFEAVARLPLHDPDFTLTCVADRIDRDAAGDLHVIDYKTGNPPTTRQQELFDKQLLLEAAIAEEAGFKGIEPAPVASATFVGLGRSPKDVPAPLDETPAQRVLSDFRSLISAYLEPDQGFTSRRMLFLDSEIGNYDQLARFGEWDRTVPATPEALT